MVVRLGEVNARRYHACLLMGRWCVWRCLISFRCIACGAGCPAGGTITGEASPLCDAGNGPVAMRPMLERTVKGALLTNLCLF